MADLRLKMLVTWSFIVQLYNPLKGCLVRIVSNVQ